MSLIAVALGLIFAYSAASTAYLFIFALAGFWASKQAPEQARPPRLRGLPPQIAVLIPAYREDAVIESTVKHAFQQDYPSDAFDVIVVDDQLQPETRERLAALPVECLRAHFDRSTKVKALQLAMDVIEGRGHDMVVVLDADNLMAPGFLKWMAHSVTPDSPVVQGRRVAKNHGTPISGLDEISEAINNHVFRLGHQALGLSAALIGSGMTFRADLFRELIHANSAIGGFDKELELEILRRRTRIVYCANAVVQDEKVATSGGFVTQRTRWLSAQLHYGLRYLRELPGALASGRIDYADKIIQMWLPPRAVLLAMVVLGGGLSFGILRQSATAWTGLFVALLMVLCLATDGIPVRRLVRAAVHLPMGVILMTVALLRSPWGNRRFLHTRHAVVQPTTLRGQQ